MGEGTTGRENTAVRVALERYSRFGMLLYNGDAQNLLS
jgi:hypothetical protein